MDVWLVQIGSQASTGLGLARLVCRHQCERSADGQYIFLGPARRELRKMTSILKCKVHLAMQLDRSNVAAPS